MTPDARNTATPFTVDPRRAIPRHVWLTNRASNALQRPAFIGAISVATFITAIVSMIVVPRAQRQPPPVVRPMPRPDTLSMIAAAAVAQREYLQADSELVAARRELALATPPAPVVDSSALLASTVQDSLRARVDALDRLLTRAKQAPLPASYKALADVPELRSDPHVRALVDSLAEIEREREAFGAVGGVDPIFVALTSRASEIGRNIQATAVARRDEMLARLSPVATPEPVVAAAPAIDTLPILARRDSARLTFQQANDSLVQRRQVARALDLEEERARERAMAVAPPLALLASAFVLSAVIGFAGALVGEVRRPRVSNAHELERLLGVRVLSTAERSMPSTERGRRQADRAAPPYFDPGAEAYQLAYLGLATDHPALLTASVTGDDAAIAAVVACNLAAVAADEARNTLIMDLDPACMAAATLRVRSEPGVSDIVRGDASWPDATVTARVGRDKSVDLVPFGSAARVSADELKEMLSRDGSRVSRYYDAAFAVLSPAQAKSGVLATLPGAELVYCARPGMTPLRALSDDLDGIRAAGGRVRGVVLWNAERPMLPTDRIRDTARKRTSGEKPALAHT